MSPFGPLNPVEPVWPRRPPGERRERGKQAPPAPEPDEEQGPAAEDPQSGGQSGDGKPPVPGRIVDDYA
jgi:hypothetical protein